MSVHSQPFEQLLLECIDEGLSVLGNEPQHALYQYLLTICSLPREEIPDRVADFAAGIGKAFSWGSTVNSRIIFTKTLINSGSSLAALLDTEFTQEFSYRKRRS